MDNIVEDEAMRQIKFSVPGQPFGKQRPKFSRAGQYVKTYTPDETVSYETERNSNGSSDREGQASLSLKFCE